MMKTRNAYTWVGLFIATTLLAGCGGSGATRQSVVDHYNAGRYDKAYQGADRLSRTAFGAERDEMAYIAGVSAYRISKHQRAISHLKPVTRSSDEQLAGRAGATLSLSYMATRRNDLALTELKQAAGKLSGPDRAQAYLQMGIAQQRLGQWSAARSSLVLARSAASSPGLIAEIDRRLAIDSYTLQFGAFTTAEQASRYAREIGNAVRAAYLVGPIVKPGSTTLHHVYAGRFTNQQTAEQARQRMGSIECFVVPTSSKR